MNPRSGKIIDRLGTDRGVEGPDDLAFGPDGSIYWTSILTGEVGRLTPAGELSTQFVAPGVNPITFSDDGRLFVALDFLGDGLYELDPELVDPPRPIVISTPDVPVPLGFLNGMDWGPDGRLYGPLWTQGQVISIDVDSCTATSDPWNDCDIRTVTAGLGIPAAVKFNSKGRLHVIDHLTGELFRVKTKTGKKKLIAQLAPGLDNLAFDSRDRLFISHAQDGTIFRVSPRGCTRRVSRGGMIVPGGVAVLPRAHGRESVYVADLFTLREFDGRTGRRRGVDRHFLAAGGLISPFTVAADGDNLVLTSWFDMAVQVWNPKTKEAVLTYHDVPVPLNAIGFQGDLAVAQLGTGSVVRASDGFPLASGLFVPVGLAASGDDLWVSDWATGIVWQIVDEGVPLAPPIPVAMGLSSPEGLAVDLDGSLLVVEAGAGRLSRIDPTTGAVTLVADGLALGAEGVPGMPPTWNFNGVAIGPSGAIYVTGDVASVLYRFRPSH
jgi:sugar lactone lactonase YvrE